MKKIRKASKKVHNLLFFSEFFFFFCWIKSRVLRESHTQIPKKGSEKAELNGKSSGKLWSCKKFIEFLSSFIFNCFLLHVLFQFFCIFFFYMKYFTISVFIASSTAYDSTYWNTAAFLRKSSSIKFYSCHILIFQFFFAAAVIKYSTFFKRKSIISLGNWGVWGVGWVEFLLFAYKKIVLLKVQEKDPPTQPPWEFLGKMEHKKWFLEEHEQTLIVIIIFQTLGRTYIKIYLFFSLNSIESLQFI